MRIRWRNLELPTRVVADPATRTDTYAKFLAEPFERGYGVTVGNGIRRVLLASIEGTAVTSIKIAGVKHEFSSLEGIKEDVTDIVLAVKRLRVRFHTDDPKVLSIEKKGPGPVTGADVGCGSDCEVVNKDLVLCTLTTDRSFEAQLEVRKGRGYVTAEENAREEHEIGVIPVDAIFSPVQRVRYRTENTRVGKMTNYDRLVLELWTDGTVTPEMALVEAGKIYRKHLTPFATFFDAGKDLQAPAASGLTKPAAAPPAGAPSGGMPSEGLMGEALAAAAAPAAAVPAAPAEPPAAVEPAVAPPAGSPPLSSPIDVLGLTTRAKNALNANGFHTLSDLAAKTFDEAVDLTKNLGRSGMREVERKLEAVGHSFKRGAPSATAPAEKGAPEQKG